MFELRREVLIPAPLDDVFDFFSDPANLAKITPKSVGFQDLTPGSSPMRPGLHIIHQIRWLGIPVRWETLIEEYDPPHGFVDVQVKGPYKRWRHEHSFEAAPGGTIMRDHVQYELPFGILGVITHRLIVARQLRRIFDYRGRKIRKLFARTGAPAA
jgi:ligand-binding SRPBCC domain-containing protein